MTYEDNVVERNREAVCLAFERWREGRGTLFDLMAPDVRWEIVGHSAVAGTYPTKEALMDRVIVPLNKRFARPLVPSVRNVYADGDTVVALFDAETVATDGLPYRNSYSWFLRFRDGSIVDVVAFFDSVAFNELWMRVSPA